MPFFGNDEIDYNKVAQVRARIRAELLAKGLFEGGSKYNEVMGRKLSKARSKGELHAT